MADKPSKLEASRQQLFPVFSESELHRIRRFGIIRQYLAGAMVTAVGQRTDGLLFILSGTVAVTSRGACEERPQIATYGPGAFVGELSDLSGGLSAFSAKSLSPLSALVVSPEGLYALLGDAPEIGGRLVRALVLRHSGITELACVIVIGSESSQDVARLARLLRRKGRPMRILDPDSDQIARTLIQRLKVAQSIFPVLLCADGRLLCNPTDGDLSLTMDAPASENQAGDETGP